MPTNENETDDAAERGPSRGRSPNYPALTFTDALGRAEILYKKERRTPVSPDVAAQHWGYSKMNGSSFPILGSLKRYGLVETVGKDIRISDDAHFILCHPPEDPERIKRIAKLAMSPDIFAEVVAKYPDIPSERSLVAKLQTEWKFLEPAAKLIVPALADAIRLRDAALALDADEGDSGQESPKESAMTQATQHPMSAAISPTAGHKFGTVPMPSGSVPMPPPPVGGLVRTWEIDDGRFASITLPADPTVEDLDSFEEYLAILKAEIALKWKKKARAAGQAGGS